MNVFYSRPLRGCPSHGLVDPSGAGTIQGTFCRDAPLRSGDNSMTLLNVNACWREIAVGCALILAVAARSVAGTGEEEL